MRIWFWFNRSLRICLPTFTVCAFLLRLQLHYFSLHLFFLPQNLAPSHVWTLILLSWPPFTPPTLKPFFCQIVTTGSLEIFTCKSRIKKKNRLPIKHKYHSQEDIQHSTKLFLSSAYIQILKTFTIVNVISSPWSKWSHLEEDGSNSITTPATWCQWKCRFASKSQNTGLRSIGWEAAALGLGKVAWSRTVRFLFFF